MKIVVLKISGKTIDEFISSDKWISAINNLMKKNNKVIIVHGAGKTITEWGDKLGYKSVFVEGQRVTTSEMMDVVAAVQAGMLNSKISARLNSSGVEAVGLSGIDRKTFTAEYVNDKIGFVGRPELTGSTAWIKSLLKKNVVPVFSSVCCSAEGNLMNTNADVFTEVLSSSLKADTVYFVSDVNGVIINNEIKECLTWEEIYSGIENEEITGGMIPKLKSCTSLLNKGIKKIWIGSDLLSQLNEVSNCGTWITPSAAGSVDERIAQLKVA